MIGIWPGKRLDNAYSGNVVDICPVGALTLKDFRFATRVWYIKNTPSVCAGCSRGCNVVIGVGKQRELMTTEGQQDDRIKRVVPRVNEAVNAHWICDEGRLSYQRVENATRLRTAESPPGSELDWDVAVKRAAEALKESAAAARVAAILSPRLTNETLYAWSELFGGLGQVRVGVRSLVRGEDDDVLIRADKGANSTGAAWIFGENASEVSVLDAVAAGEIDTLLIAGDTLDPADTAHLDEASLAKVRNLIYVGPFVDATAKTSGRHVGQFRGSDPARPARALAAQRESSRLARRGRHRHRRGVRSAGLVVLVGRPGSTGREAARVRGPDRRENRHAGRPGRRGDACSRMTR
jgi:NADH-quinone oxidoreductase subunit G